MIRDKDIRQLQRIFLQRLYAYLLALCLLLLIPSLSFASDANYIYDDTGRLIKVVSETGDVAIYNYDGVGDLISITTTSTTDTVAIVDINPWEGDIGTVVTIYGKGFSSTPGQNIVSFNGVPTSVTSSTSNIITTSVPAGATSGRVSVQSPLGSAISSKDFTVKQAISITISPSLAFLTSGKIWQFTATVTGTANTAVTWSVEGIEGGAQGIGTITADGLYTSPVNAYNLTMVTIAARSIADISKIATVPVYLTVANTSSNIVSVAFQPQPQTIQRGPVISNAVSIGLPKIVIGNYGPVVSNSVSIGFNNQTSIAYGPVVAPYVSLFVGPYISSISPTTGAQGSNLLMALNGSGFAGTSSIAFYRNGAIDTEITASNIQVNAEGIQITADINISSTAVVGTRLFKIVSSYGTSQGYYTEGNIFTIITP